MTDVNKGSKSTRKSKAVAGAAAFLLVASINVAHAEDVQSAFVMTVIADQAQGEKMIAGEYVQAIAAITAPKVRQDGFAESNNLCVAYAKTNELDRAGEACADALRVSRSAFGPWYEVSSKRSDHAVALSNRGVVRAITGDMDGARSDFERARRLNDKLAAPANNLARLEQQEMRTVSSL